jgi:adenylosuccinate synthase
MMHLDTMAGLEEVKICRAYQIHGRQTTFFPGDSSELEAAECIYETLPGWKEDLSKIQKAEDLPPAVRRYLDVVESFIGIPITMVGVGPQRSQIIYRNPL